MQLTQHQADDLFVIHSLRPEGIRIGEDVFSHSVLLTPDQGVAAWPVKSIDELDHGHIEPILKSKPEIVLLATGRKQRFPARALQIEFLKHSIGLEVMTLEAAARTYNVLASEDRRVLAAMIWEP